MLKFNFRGLLIPDGIISSTITELEYEFSINLYEGKRRMLFEQYLLYCKNLKTLCGESPIIQWIDGSYVTQSKNPSDIDLVFFISYDIVKEKEKELREFLYPQSKEIYGIDGYLVVIYPGNSKYESYTKSDRAYWIDHFGKTKPNRQRKRLLKGFLEIIT